MGDSRGISTRLISNMEKVVDIQSKVIYFLLSIIVAFVMTYWLNEPEFEKAQIFVLFLLFFAICLWITEAIPPFAVGLLVFGFLIFAMSHYYNQVHTENTKEYYLKYVNSWSNSVIWIMLGGFFMAESMKKVGLDKVVFKLSVMRFGSSPKKILLGLMITTALFSMVMSNTAVTAMMIASVVPFLSKIDKVSPGLSKSLLIGIAASASIGGMGTLIGSPPNAIAIEALNHHGVQVGFLEWMMVGFPSALILTVFLWFFLVRKYVLSNSHIKLELEDSELNKKSSFPKITKLKKQVVLAVLSLSFILWLTEKVHGIPASVVSLFPIVLLTISGIINGDDVRKLPWDTLMLVAGGLALGLAIKETGLAHHYVEKIEQYNINFYFMVFLFALLTVILSNVMSNTATATILIPVAIILTFRNPVVLPLVIGLCASAALLLPISTPPNAIAYSTGKLKQKDFRFGGLLIGVVGPLIISIIVLVIFSFYQL